MSSSNEEMFFNELLGLCKKYKVNIEQCRVDFIEGKETYSHVSVNGGWDIKKEYDALVADKIVQPELTSEFTIKGWS